MTNGFKKNINLIKWRKIKYKIELDHKDLLIIDPVITSETLV